MIKEKIKNIIDGLGPGVELVAATKTRSISEVREAIDAGVKNIGENYVQEAQAKFKELGNSVRWHYIGHLQKNKVRLAVKIFDLIETVDSLPLAKIIDKECAKINKTMPVLVEVNSAAEPQKAGVLIEEVENLIYQIMDLEHIEIKGLMTMGPWLDDPEQIRPYFCKTKELFDQLTLNFKNKLDLKYLSMGMSDSYLQAVQEGANIVRLGTVIFGPRK